MHDTEDKTWRHLDFFQYQAHLHAKLPRVRCPGHGVRQVAVSWARRGSGFTLLFEARLITFASAMPVARVAAFTGEHDTRIWRVLEHYVRAERAKLDFTEVERVGVDETAAARDQDYVSVFMDADAHRVLFATPGRGGDTVKAFAEDLKAHGASRPYLSVQGLRRSSWRCSGPDGELRTIASGIQRAANCPLCNISCAGLRKSYTRRATCVRTKDGRHDSY